MQFKMYALTGLLVIAGCGPSDGRRGPNGGGSNPDGGGGPGGMNIPNCDPTNNQPDDDKDHDGYTVNAGDCNDCNPSVNPGAIQIPGDSADYACNGMPGVVPSCDGMNVNKNDPSSLAQAFEQCDNRFFKSATLVGPSDPKARKVVATFGSVKPQQGANMALLSTGYAVDKTTMSGYEPQEGANLGNSNSYANPLPGIPDNPMCPQGGGGGMMCQPQMVHDYTELVVKLKAPTNVHSFTFQFHFFSAEYPEFVCTQFNDEFLVLMESNSEFQTAANISFDTNMNPITVNNGLFSVCKNGTASYTMNCKHPISDIAGTGYEDPNSAMTPSIGGNMFDTGNLSCLSSNPTMPADADPIGGSTGWLTTTAPVTPGEDVTLHFIIFDEGDHIYDSAVLIDNFVWGTSVVNGPSTGPIG